MSAKHPPGPVTIRRIGSDEPSVVVAAAELTRRPPPDDEHAEVSTAVETFASGDEPRLLSKRPGFTDYTESPAVAMHDEPEAVREAVQAKMSKDVRDRETAAKATIAVAHAEQVAKVVGEVEAIGQSMKDNHVLTRPRHRRLQAALGELRALGLGMRT
jgi:hypothetical protein